MFQQEPGFVQQQKQMLRRMSMAYGERKSPHLPLLKVPPSKYEGKYKMELEEDCQESE